MKKTFYLLLLAFALFGSAMFYLNLPYGGDTIVVFHLDAFGVTWHHITNIAILIILVMLYTISWLKFLVPSAISHKTEIMRR